ncbi:MAG: UDP-N-acetylglucosamine 1-carboxyvinyltransferase [Firmicutes bacterium HGW-Firmicutes-14]|nr:MAG: UDP-N-acetylglucosamine 1-carboxyvinyltransferase [Firmicutes bacterium HGW-Firmicutes-14]
MEKLVIRGGKPLTGRVRISGAKNAVLPVIASTLLVNGTCCIRGVPCLTDVRMMVDLLGYMGADISWEGETLSVRAGNLNNREAPFEYVSKMRASFLIMGPLLARFGQARIFMPGGCNIGTRPIDLHLKGFVSLGAEVIKEKGYVEARIRDRLKGTRVYLDFPSVGATENIMMAAVMAEGTTHIQNAAEEPEIVDLANFLNAMGGRVSGAGTNLITIEGVPSLRGSTHTVIPDRVEAGTYMVAATLTGGEVYLENVISEHLKPVIAKLEEVGAKIKNGGAGVRVTAPDKILPINLQTLPYPGFPTDMQSQMTSLLAVADGTSIITETVFENRFMHTEELIRMGADIKVDGRIAVIKGVSRLSGARVQATDLRGGAALIIAALAASGQTEIGYVYHVDRGYERLEEKLGGLGADISRA